MVWQLCNLSNSRCIVSFAMPMHGVATRKSDISHVEGFPGT
jgi:hypothetical protein